MQKLYVVATPIGNLRDISSRALEVLEDVDCIFCEDTRVTKKLLSHYNIGTRTKRLDANIEGKIAENIYTLFEECNTIALVTDAGTPGISDPGSRFVAAVRTAGISINVVPGPSALAAALSVAGVPADQFLFLGFLPHKKGRQTLFKEIRDSHRTVVLYESPHRILKTLESLKENLTIYRTVVVARELTKVHEEVVSGTPQKVLAYFVENPEKVQGEFVVIIFP